MSFSPRKTEILMLGFGYCAQHLSALLQREGFIINATTRDLNKINHWQALGINMISHDKKQIESKIKTCSHLLISAPPNADGSDPMLALIQAEMIKNKKNIRWIGYLSATSVYGNHKGQLVNENSKPIAAGSRGRKRLQAEKNWQILGDQFNLPIHIFRLAGIYGPNRNVLVRLLNGKRYSIVKAGQVFSRIHVADISRALLASIKQPTPGEIYNLADEYPSPPEDIDAYAAKLLDLPELERLAYEKAELSPMARSFYQDNRKVDNTKFKTRFNFKLLYPTYKEGLNALYQALKKSENFKR